MNIPLEKLLLAGENFTRNNETSRENLRWPPLKDFALFFGALAGYLVFVAIIGEIANFICQWYTSKRVGKVTKIPFVPQNYTDLVQFSIEEGTSEVRVFCGSPKSWWFNLNNAKLNSLMTIIFNSCNFRIPKTAKIISIKMQGFEHGDKPHEFIPILGHYQGRHGRLIPFKGPAPRSFFTFQLFGDHRIQVSSYVEDGVPYVAGFCLYVERHSLWGVNFREDVVRKIMSSRRYLTRSERRRQLEIWDLKRGVEVEDVGEASMIAQVSIV